MSDFVHNPIPQVVVVQDLENGGVKVHEVVNSDMDHRTEKQSKEASDLEAKHKADLDNIKVGHKKALGDKKDDKLSEKHYDELAKKEFDQRVEMQKLHDKHQQQNLRAGSGLSDADIRALNQKELNLDQQITLNPGAAPRIDQKDEFPNDPTGPTHIIDSGVKSFTTPVEEVNPLEGYRATTPEQEHAGVDALFAQKSITEKRRDEWHKEIDAIGKVNPGPVDSTATVVNAEDEGQNVSPPPYSNINKTQYSDAPAKAKVADKPKPVDGKAAMKLDATKPVKKATPKVLAKTKK